MWNPEISERTHIRMSLATTIAVIGGLMAGTGYVWNIENRADQALMVAETANVEIEKLTLVVRIGDVKRNIKDLQAELRGLRRAQADDPNSQLISDQIQQVEFQITSFEATLRCYRNSPEPERCEQ